MNNSELKIARTRLLDKNINFYNAKAQDLSFIRDSSKDVDILSLGFNTYGSSSSCIKN